MASKLTQLRNRRGAAITVICWNAAEGRARAATLRQAGFKVLLQSESRQGPAILRKLREEPPDALVIGLDRLPMQGRDVGVVIRTGKPTRQIPIVFAGGDPVKVERVRQMLPDAAYTPWTGVAAAIERAIAEPKLNPVVPRSNLAGYSGTPLLKKLGIKPSCCVALLGEPDNFVELFGEIPDGVRLVSSILPDTKLAIWFVRSAAELAAQVDSVAAALAGRGNLWICWAKRTSPLATDVCENDVRAAGLAAGLVDYKVAAIDADWSGLLFAPRREAPKSEER
jgi:hypothetical protein